MVFVSAGNGRSRMSRWCFHGLGNAVQKKFMGRKGEGSSTWKVRGKNVADAFGKRLPRKCIFAGSATRSPDGVIRSSRPEDPPLPGQAVEIIRRGGCEAQECSAVCTPVVEIPPRGQDRLELSSRPCVIRNDRCGRNGFEAWSEKDNGTLPVTRLLPGASSGKLLHGTFPARRGDALS